MTKNRDEFRSYGLLQKSQADGFEADLKTAKDEAAKANKTADRLREELLEAQENLVKSKALAEELQEKLDAKEAAAKKAVAAKAKKKAPRYVEGKAPVALLKSPLAATPGKSNDQVCAENPIIKARIKRGLPPTVPACDVEGKPGVKGVPIANGCAEIMWSKYKDPDTGLIRVVQGLPKKTVNGVDYDYKIGKVIPMDWLSCGSRRVFVDGTKQCADGHVNCID